MTIQQALLGVSSGGLSSYVGFSSATNTTSQYNYTTVTAPSAAQPGDLILLLGWSRASVSSYTLSKGTMLLNSYSSPWIFMAHSTLSSAGQKFTVLAYSPLTVPLTTTIYAVAYRGMSYSNHSLTTLSFASSGNATITPANSNSSAIGLLVNYSKTNSFAYTETAPATTATLRSGTDDLLFTKEAISSSLTYSFTGLNNSYNTQAGLIAVRPV